MCKLSGVSMGHAFHQDFVMHSSCGIRCLFRVRVHRKLSGISMSHAFHQDSDAVVT